jgi:hypothetical protein
MKKHIKVQAVVVVNLNKVLFRTLEQTHIGNDFASYTNRDPRKFQASNGIILASNVRPARDEREANVVWLQGSSAAKRGAAIACTSAEWEKIAAAIKEYNEFNFPVKPAYVAPPAAPARAAGNPCAIIIG